MKKLSIVTNVYNEAEIVRDIYEVIKKIVEKLGPEYDYEHIFTDNCSTDETVRILKEIAARDKRVKILVLSKNFGASKSAFMGYKYAAGDAVIAFPGNLKEPPDVIPTFVAYWEKGYDVVYGIRDKSEENMLITLCRKTFYRLVNSLSDEDLPVDAGSFRLVDRKVVNELVMLDDYKPYIRGLIASIGFKQIGVPYTRHKRLKGRSKSNLGYLIDFAINAMVSYSIAPMRLCTYIGLGLGCVSFLTLVLYIILKLSVWKAQIPAVAGVIILVLFFSAVNLFFLGIFGEYLAAIHSQVRKKPFAVIAEKINLGA